MHAHYPDPVTSSFTTGLILCGGEGRRLGGLDKPLRKLAGKPLIERIISRLRHQTCEIIISANRNKQSYRRYAPRVLDDGEFRGRGPLAGLYSGLARAGSEWLLCVPGDAPAIPLDFAERLFFGLKAAGSRIAYVDDGTGPQRLCCLLQTSLAPDLYHYLSAGHHVPGKWFAQHRPAVVDFSDWPLWGWSINTPEQWTLAEQLISKEETP